MMSSHLHRLLARDETPQIRCVDSWPTSHRYILMQNAKLFSSVVIEMKLRNQVVGQSFVIMFLLCIPVSLSEVSSFKEKHTLCREYLYV